MPIGGYHSPLWPLSLAGGGLELKGTHVMRMDTPAEQRSALDASHASRHGAVVDDGVAGHVRARQQVDGRGCLWHGTKDPSTAQERQQDGLVHKCHAILLERVALDLSWE